MVPRCPSHVFGMVQIFFKICYLCATFSDLKREFAIWQVTSVQDYNFSLLTSSNTTSCTIFSQRKNAVRSRRDKDA